MAASGFSKILKPSGFDVNPNSSGATNLFKDWFKTLENVLESAATYGRTQETEKPNRFKVLCVYVNASVYELIEDCTDMRRTKMRPCLNYNVTRSSNLMSFSRYIC